MPGDVRAAYPGVVFTLEDRVSGCPGRRTFHPRISASPHQSFLRRLASSPGVPRRTNHHLWRPGRLGRRSIQFFGDTQICHAVQDWFFRSLGNYPHCTGAGNFRRIAAASFCHEPPFAPVIGIRKESPEAGGLKESRFQSRVGHSCGIASLRSYMGHARCSGQHAQPRPGTCHDGSFRIGHHSRASRGRHFGFTCIRPRTAVWRTNRRNSHRDNGDFIGLKGIGDDLRIRRSLLSDGSSIGEAPFGRMRSPGARSAQIGPLPVAPGCVQGCNAAAWARGLDGHFA